MSHSVAETKRSRHSKETLQLIFENETTETFSTTTPKECMIYLMCFVFKDLNMKCN